MHCSQSMINDESFINISEVNCWLNMMPGGTPSFHYSGVFSIDKNLIEEFKFSNVKIFYKDELIHQSQPFIQFSDEIITDSSSIVNYHFYSGQNIKVTDKMMKAESVDFIFVFEIKDQTIEKSVKDIPLTRAY